MNGTPIKQFIADLTNEDLVTLCTDIYNWQYVNGIIEPESQLRKICDKYSEENARTITTMILDKAKTQLQKCVLLLLQTRTHAFVKEIV